MTDLYDLLASLRREGRPAVVVTVVQTKGHAPTDVQSKMVVDASGRRGGTIGGGAIEKQVIAEALEVLAERRPRLREYLLDDATAPEGMQSVPMVCGGQVTLFYEYIGPQVHAYLFGAGHCNLALAAFLEPLDFAVTFVDARAEYLTDLASPHLQAGQDYTSLPPLPELATSYVVVATHSHACDERVLEQILASGARPPYLGVVASRRKRKVMLANLRARLGEDVDLDDIFMPIGLHLGGNSPAAVALSIAAEMQAHRHGITGHRHLRDREPSS